MTSVDDAAPSAPIHPGWSGLTPKKAKAQRKLTPLAPPLAVLKEHQFFGYLAALFQEFRRDDAFRAALVDLASSLTARLGEGVAQRGRAADWDRATRALRRDPTYATTVADFAATWKLDRLPFTGDEPAGMQALHTWLLARFVGWAEGTAPSDADALNFGTFGMSAGPLPHIVEQDTDGEPIVLSRRRDDETGEEYVMYRLRVPITAVPLTVSYDPPSSESRADAEARNLIALRAALDKIEAEHRNAGYAFVDVAHERAKHAGWCYRRLVYGRSYRAIADEWNSDKDRITSAGSESRQAGNLDHAHQVGSELATFGRPRRRLGGLLGP